MFTLIVNSNQEGVKLNYINGDYSHLNGVYINNVPDETNTQEKQDELCALMFDPESGEGLLQEITTEEAEILCHEDDFSIILCGFIL